MMKVEVLASRHSATPRRCIEAPAGGCTTPPWGARRSAANPAHHTSRVVGRCRRDCSRRVVDAARHRRGGASLPPPPGRSTPGGVTASGSTLRRCHKAPAGGFTTSPWVCDYAQHPAHRTTTCGGVRPRGAQNTDPTQFITSAQSAQQTTGQTAHHTPRRFIEA